MLSLDALVAGVLILYPRYLDPVTGLPCPPEVLVARMASASATNRLEWIAPLRRWQGRINGRFSMTEVILDISRLISRVRYSTPSGVDRVEMAYARGLLGRLRRGLAFAAVHPSGLYGRVKRKAALNYLDELERRWSRQEGNPRQRSLASVMPWLAALLPARRVPRSPEASMFRHRPSSDQHCEGASHTGA
jgi:hypothetical protein